MTEKESARHHFALFDSLRGLAVLSVIGFHVASLALAALVYHAVERPAINRSHR